MGRRTELRIDGSVPLFVALAVKLPRAQGRYLDAVAAGQKPLAALVHANVSEPQLEGWLRDDAVFRDAYAGVKRIQAEMYEVSRDEVTRGLLEAVDVARRTGSPQAMVAAWKELAALHGVGPGAAARVFGPDAVPGGLALLSDADLLAIDEADWTEAPAAGAVERAGPPP